MLEQDLAGVIATDVPDTGGYYWHNVDSFNLGSGSDYFLHLDDDMADGCSAELGPLRHARRRGVQHLRRHAGRQGRSWRWATR